MWYDEAQQIQDDETVNADLVEAKFSGVTNCATNATRPNILGRTIAKIWTGTGNSRISIATIIGCITGKPFTLVRMSSNASYWIGDAGNFILSASWYNGYGDTLTLIWDGTKYFEVTRSNN